MFVFIDFVIDVSKIMNRIQSLLYKSKSVKIY